MRNAECGMKDNFFSFRIPRSVVLFAYRETVKVALS